MKKIFYCIVLFVLLFSCAKERTEQVSAGCTQFSISLPEGLTKTVLGDKTAGAYPVLWGEGDVLGINGVDSAPLASGGSATADFSFSGELMPPYNIVYGGVEGNDDIVEIPFRQQVSASGTFASGAAPMWTMVSSGSSGTLNHLGAALSIPVNGSGTVAHIRVSATGGESVCGEFLLAKTTGKLNGGISLAAGIPELYVVPEGGAALSASDYVFVAVVAPGTYSQGLDAAVTLTDGSIMHLHAFSGETLSAGTVYEFSSTTFAADDRLDRVIASASDLANYRTDLDADEIAQYGRATLVADIDASAWTTYNGFKGTLDGAGHIFSGVTVPLFNELNGAVLNLTAEASISGAYPVNDKAWTAAIAQRMAASGNYIPCIRNCTVKGSVTMTNAQTSDNINLGGIVGYMVAGTLGGCRSEAEITLTASSGSKTLNIGGIAGRLYSGSAAMTLENCTNAGTVSAAGTANTVNIGGVAGASATPSGNSIDYCVNIGSVTQGATASTANCGLIVGNSSNGISNCLWRGTVN